MAPRGVRGARFPLRDPRLRARARHADANALANQILIDMARHLADSGVDPKGISGRARA
jgi:hypothetical protein